MKLVTFTSSKLFVTQSPPSPSTLFSVCDCDVLLVAEKAVQGFKLSFQKKRNIRHQNGKATNFIIPPVLIRKTHVDVLWTPEPTKALERL